MSPCRGFVGVSLNSKNSLESPFGKGGQAIREVQQDAAGFGGTPEGEHETRPYKGYAGMCRGAKPLCRGFGGVPQFL